MPEKYETLGIIEDLKAQLEGARHVGSIVVFGLDLDECYATLERLKATIPAEIQKAQSIIQRQEMIIENANDQAQRTLSIAQSQAQQMLDDASQQSAAMVEQNTIVAQAMDRANQIVAEAEAKSYDLRNGADEYARDVLNRVEEYLSKSLNTVQRGKEQLGPSQRSR